MKREIKFRAWDGEEMYPGGFSLWKGLGSDNTSGSDVVIMQYTGLHDKNGKEIYEGDIIKSKTYSGNPEVVEWGGSQSDYEQGGYAYGYYTEWGLESGDYEIIGNIYENPELIK